MLERPCKSWNYLQRARSLTHGTRVMRGKGMKNLGVYNTAGGLASPFVAGPSAHALTGGARHPNENNTGPRAG